MMNNVQVRGDPALPGALIERHSARERVNHWLLAASFFLAGLSGLALFHPAVFWLSGLFGGGPWTRILHPFLGLAAILFFLLLASTTVRNVALQSRDWSWLRRIGDVVSGHEERLPEVGRYNAGQKLVFWIVGLALAGLLLTGIAMWRVYFAAYFPIGVIRGATLAHAIIALLLFLTIIVHIDSAIWVRGSIRSMIRGWVTPGWAWKHHRAWYREILTHAASSRPRPD
jgi:formate dehydrogenase subunit gamma